MIKPKLSNAEVNDYNKNWKKKKKKKKRKKSETSVMGYLRNPSEVRVV